MSVFACSYTMAKGCLPVLYYPVLTLLYKYYNLGSTCDRSKPQRVRVPRCDHPATLLRSTMVPVSALSRISPHWNAYRSLDQCREASHLPATLPRMFLCDRLPAVVFHPFTL